MVVPLNHPCSFTNFHYKASILGYPHLCKPPYGYELVIWAAKNVEPTNHIFAEAETMLDAWDAEAAAYCPWMPGTQYPKKPVPTDPFPYGIFIQLPFCDCGWYSTFKHIQIWYECTLYPNIIQYPIQSACWQITIVSSIEWDNIIKISSLFIHHQYIINIWWFRKIEAPPALIHFHGISPCEAFILGYPRFRKAPLMDQWWRRKAPRRRSCAGLGTGSSEYVLAKEQRSAWDPVKNSARDKECIHYIHGMYCELANITWNISYGHITTSNTQ